MIRIYRHIWLLSFLVILAGCLMGSASAANQLATRENRYKIAYATYLGGDQWDQAREIIPYPNGTVLVGGMTSSSNMITTAGVVQPKYAGDDPSLGHGGVIGGDAFLVRLSSDGREILTATYFGGSKQERNVYGMELDRFGNVVITSMTRSRDLLTAEGCFQPEHGGGSGSSFAAKLSGDLNQQHSAESCQARTTHFFRGRLWI